ncbi:MAG: DNA repair protein RecO [Coriobacteriales bacterium]
MGASYKARCIVLKKTKLGEADLIVTMLSEQGTQVKGVAKGARKPGNKRFGARLEPFSTIELQLYPGRSLDTITEVRVLASNDACRLDLEHSGACSLMAELVAKAIADGEAGERMYPMLAAALQAAGAAPADRALLIAEAFCVKALALLGVRPALRSCALCGEPLGQPAAFSLSGGGCLCAACAGGSSGSMDLALVPWVDALLGSTFAQLSAVEGAPLLPLLSFAESWAREHLGISLKTASFLRMSFGSAPLLHSR